MNSLWVHVHPIQQNAFRNAYIIWSHVETSKVMSKVDASTSNAELWKSISDIQVSHITQKCLHELVDRSFN